MHIFLHGPRRIGKSTVIHNTISLLRANGPLRLGGFVTYWGGEDDPHLYIADAERRLPPTKLADLLNGGLIRHTEVFEHEGVALLAAQTKIQLICMDELGFLEQYSPLFQQQALACLEGNIPVLGVLREGDIPWHAAIKNHPRVTLYEVNRHNQEHMPAMLCSTLLPYVRKAGL